MSAKIQRGSALVAALVLVLLCGGAAAWWLLRSDPGAAPPNDPLAAQQPDATGAPAAVPPATVPLSFEPPDTPEERRAMLLLPDGSAVPNLNGVTDTVKFKWTTNHPYSRIVGKRLGRKPGDWDWYEHEDGSLSTTVMLWRSDLGRKDAVSLVTTPQSTAPIDPRLAQQMYEEGQLGSNPDPKK